MREKLYASEALSRNQPKDIMFVNEKGYTQISRQQEKLHLLAVELDRQPKNKQN